MIDLNENSKKNFDIMKGTGSIPARYVFFLSDPRP